MGNSIDCSFFWKGNYQLIDCGNKEKLEKFGTYIIRRPEPQALWQPDLTEKEWEKLADASFFRDSKNPEKGEWKLKNHVREPFHLSYTLGNTKELIFKLGFTSFKHLGIFPEQAYNWEFLYNELLKRKNAKVLNLFAYTGGASLACKAAGADVVHLDAVKQVVQWAKENMLLSKLDGIRWIVDDATKFVAREVRRKNNYDAVILDPPSYGRGPNGEKWILEDDLLPLLLNITKITHPKTLFVINLYSLGYSVELLTTLMCKTFGCTGFESGELVMSDKFNKKLPLGIFFRTN
jgi:23S rRNA (cytosine1962-C5)-methyltransferase